MLFLAIFIQKIADFIPDITTSFLTLNDMGFLVSSSKVLFSLPFGICVSLFLFISAIFHYLVSLTKKLNDYYNLGLKNNINVFR